jgi:hypothetical protein
MKESPEKYTLAKQDDSAGRGTERKGKSRLRIHPLFVLAALAGGALFCLLGTAYGIAHLKVLTEELGAWAWAIVILEGVFFFCCLVALIKRTHAWRGGRWQGASLATFRLLFYLLFAGLIAKLLLFPPELEVMVFICFGAGFAVFSLVQLALKRVGEARPRPLLRIADIVLLNLCILAVGAELSLRILTSFISSPLFARALDRVERNLELHRLPPGTVRYGFPCNEGGHYDTSFTPRADMPVVVAIGDSYSQGVVPHHFHFTSVCERALEDCAIYNMGIAATGPAEYLHLMKTEALPLDPDLIVINLFMGNDISDCLGKRLRDLTDILRYGFAPDNFFLYLLPSRFARIHAEEQKTGHGAGEIQGEKAGDEQIISSMDALHEEFPWLADPMKEQPSFSKENYLEICGDRIGIACGEWDAPYKALFSLLDEMVAAAGEVPLAFLLIPDEFQIENQLWNDVLSELDSIKVDRFQPQRLIKEWLDARGLPYLDLLPIFQEVPATADGNKHLYHFRDTHFNTRGNEKAGEALATFIDGLLKDAGASMTCGRHGHPDRGGLHHDLGRGRGDGVSVDLEEVHAARLEADAPSLRHVRPWFLEMGAAQNSKKDLAAPEPTRAVDQNHIKLPIVHVRVRSQDVVAGIFPGIREDGEGRPAGLGFVVQINLDRPVPVERHEKKRGDHIGITAEEALEQVGIALEGPHVEAVARHEQEPSLPHPAQVEGFRLALQKNLGRLHGVQGNVHFPGKDIDRSEGNDAQGRLGSGEGVQCLVDAAVAAGHDHGIEAPPGIFGQACRIAGPLGDAVLHFGAPLPEGPLHAGEIALDPRGPGYGTDDEPDFFEGHEKTSTLLFSRTLKYRRV